MPNISVGQIIGGKYQIIRLLGAGGMGAVYEAENPEIHQRVAIKVLVVDLNAQPGLFQRFVNEARAANQTRHPGVAKVGDFGQLPDGTPWMAVEFVEGDSLASRMEAALHFPGNCLGINSLWMVGELASVLEAAHAQGIVHRDLKPANVMLVPDPRSLHGEHIKLLDFGIAKLVGGDLTKSGVLLGTPAYMAPEQFKSAGDVDGQADIYALGTIAFQILSGRLPFEGRGTYELMAAKCFDVPTPLGKYAPSLPNELQAFVMRMLEREPAQRPTAVEVEAEVRRILGLPVPRQTGGHNLLLAPAPPIRPQAAALHTPGDPSSDDTPDLSSQASAAVQAALGPTPSEQRAVGELEPSPRRLEVPQSLSSIPSVPMQVPSLRQAQASERIASGAPARLAAAALASPSAPTERDPSRRRPIYLLGVGLAMVALVGTTVAWWPDKRLAPSSPATTSHLPPVSLQPPKAPATRPGDTAAVSAPMAATPAPAPSPAEASHPSPSNATRAENKETLEKPMRTSARSAERSCTTQAPGESCLLTKMTKHQRDLAVNALRKSGVKWCPGERMMLSGFPSHPYLSTAPPSMKRESSAVYELIGLLLGSSLPSDVEIRCPR